METVGIDVVTETKTKQVHSGGKLDNRFNSADQYQLLNAAENKSADTPITGVIYLKATDGMYINMSQQSPNISCYHNCVVTEKTPKPQSKAVSLTSSLTELQAKDWQ